MKESDIHEDAEIAATAVIGPDATVRAGATVHDFAVVKNSVVGSDAVVGTYTLVRDSQLAEGSMVGAHAEIVRSEIDENAGIHSGYIGDSTLGEGTRLGAGTVIANNRFDDAPGDNRHGAEIGDNVRTGVICAIMPGVSIGDRAMIGPGTLVTDDVSEQELVFADQTQSRRSR